MPAKALCLVSGILLTLFVVVLPGPWGPDDIPDATTAEESTRVGDSKTGQKLFRRFDCVRCHSTVRGGRGTNIPPSLALAGSRASSDWIAEYLLDPQPLRFVAEDVRPDLRMPLIPMSRVEARDLAAFLSLQRDTILIRELPRMRAPENGLVARGALLFEQYQCRGCHQLEGTGARVGPAMDAVGTRRRRAYIAALLEDPNQIIPGTAMKNSDLWEDELLAITTFLLTLGRPDTE